ncbi:MAG: amino acid ABC transporter permease [Oscillospiraceae bacterium]|nr:amino acid ABC transporter permease [Oscillospiraceae bacterium]
MNGPFSIRNWRTWFEAAPLFLKGYGQTLLISLWGLSIALVIGVFAGIALTTKGGGRQRALAAVMRGYMSFFQNTPLMIQVFMFYNVLPKLGVRLSVTMVGVLGLALYTGAYAADIVASAIRAVPLGQTEAAESQGFSKAQTLWLVVLPQSVKVALPAMTNQAVNLIKNSSVLAVIAGGELMYVADSWSGSNLIYGPTFVMTGLLYLAVCLPVSMAARYLEKRSARNA